MATKKIAQAPIERVDRQPVVFQNQDSKLWLAGIVYRPLQRRADEKPFYFLTSAVLTFQRG